MTYTIAAGDTLAKIAQKFLGSSSRYMEIAQANGITNPNLIKIGQVIKIPSGASAPGSSSLLPVPVTAAPSSAEVMGPFPASNASSGGSFLQNIMGNQKLLIALALGVGLFFFWKSKQSSRSSAAG